MVWLKWKREREREGSAQEQEVASSVDSLQSSSEKCDTLGNVSGLA